MSIAAHLGALAQERVYHYAIKHPVFGDIGTYINRVKQTGEHTDVNTAVDVTVKVAGNVIFRQEAERREQWHGERLMEFRSVTATNEKRVEVSGEAQDGHFLITSPQGTVKAPADIRPSNPWSPSILKSDVMLAPLSGRQFKATIVSDRAETIKALDGTSKTLRRYEILSDKRHTIWFDDHGVPLAFRTEEGGVNIDFILVEKSGTPAASTAQGGPAGP